MSSFLRLRAVCAKRFSLPPPQRPTERHGAVRLIADPRLVHLRVEILHECAGIGVTLSDAEWAEIEAAAKG